MNDEIAIKVLTHSQIHSDMLKDFRHEQKIREKYVKDGNGYKLRKTDELRQWSEEKRIRLSRYLCRQSGRGGAVLGAFSPGGRLVGFAALDGMLQGMGDKEYANLTMLFVDDEWQRQGIGKKLFEQICLCAKDRKADKLFISAVPSHDTIAFYARMGCSDAEGIVDSFIDTEEDRYLEYVLREDAAGD